MWSSAIRSRERAEGMGLELREVSKRYGASEVLHPLSLEVANGEFLTLLGPSGSGKTTVLRLIGGFTEAVRRQDPLRWRRHHRRCRPTAGRSTPCSRTMRCFRT